jgi:FHS family glucose/mannose:H+ symporter-like MFS transporter
MRKLIWLGCISYLVIGMAHVVAGSVLESMLRWYGLDYRDGGQWIMNQFLGFLVGVLCAPLITRSIGRRNTLLAAMAVLTAAEAAYSMLLPWGWILGFALLAGVGFGLTEAVIGAIIIEYVEERKASAMTRLETFFGIGALLMPAIVAILIEHGVWQMAFPIVTAMSGVTTLLWLTLSFGKVDDLLAYTPRTVASRQPRLRYGKGALPFLTVAILFFLLYVGMEMSFSNYLPSIMIDRAAMLEATAASTMSIFWGMMVVGRIFSGRIAERLGYGRYLMISVIAGMAVFVLIAVSGNPGVSLILIGLNGLLWSGVFAIGLLYVNRWMPGMTERTTSLVVAAGGLGGALFPKLTGWIMDKYDAALVLWMITGMAIVMIVLLVLQVVYGKRLEKENRIGEGKSEIEME